LNDIARYLKLAPDQGNPGGENNSIASQKSGPTFFRVFFCGVSMLKAFVRLGLAIIITAHSRTGSDQLAPANLGAFKNNASIFNVLLLGSTCVGNSTHRSSFGDLRGIQR
jgi:hypothetical protein